MKPQYQHNLMTSFMLWFDHELLQQGEAYSNRTGQLYALEDDRLPSEYNAYASPYKQWVSDSSVSGESDPVIPDSFNGKSRDDGLIFDFDNGRVIDTQGAFANEEVVTGSFSVKDFNIYLTNQDEEDLIIENKFSFNSRYDHQPSGIAPYDQSLPAVFINTEFMKNKPFAFGGEDKTLNMVKAVVLAESEFELDGILSIFADSARKSFSKIPFDAHPITEYGDLKEGLYSYSNLSALYDESNPYHIEDVSVSKLSQKAQKKTQAIIPGGVKVGFIDFEISLIRHPRA